MKTSVAAMSTCLLSEVNEEAFSYYPQLRRLLEFYEDHYTEDIRLQQAARIAGLERTYFCTFFHQKVGVCFNCWIALLRIDHAKARMREENSSISSIAHEVGFNSLSAFTRTFKRLVGTTASQYKKQMRPC